MSVNVSMAAIPAAVSEFIGGPHKLLIDGKWVAAASNKTFSTHNPANGSLLAEIAAAEAADVDLAVNAARRAFDDGPWSRMTPAARAKLIWRLADALETHAEEFAFIETLDNGKPLNDAKIVDLPHSIEVLRYFAGWCTKLNGESISISNPGTWHAYTMREPVGVVGSITPWNAPLMMAVSKIAPALAAGCTVVLKPAEQTPLTTLRLGQLILDVGFPEGVVNILTGFGETAGAAMTAHPGIDKVTFTGSTDVGRIIIRAAANDFKRVTLELGGKTPVIVFPDADIDRAIEGAARSIFSNAGQICNAGSRLYAHRDVFEKLVDGVSRRASEFRVGPGLAASTQMGPVVSQEQLDRISGFIASGQNQGAELRVGGGRIGSEGYFIQPTVLTGTRPDMDVVQQEIFGPVLCAMSYEEADLDRIAREANATSYGLGAVLWTQNLSTAHKMAKKLKAGTVRVNGGGLDPALPFGGFKQSGWGRELGREGIEAYTELKSVAMAL
ncbi:phenylacetaldehyde dehydrogenase [Neorhizobium galegae]|uniref:aldehyde dehydrogenase family protein n=1 Tax=Neorhizobium galegae TaxID=399 RepID=UPI002780BBA1|nr:aldehyde dehydrogenase family protein [Neorhizobium galegae]MDQ0134944.1 phenylacetaldehyde dehydrogenase [Neorhizobium galegae]